MGRRKGIYYQELNEISDELSKVSKNLGVNRSLAAKVIESQFDFIKYIIQRGDFETVRMPYIGKFEVSKVLLRKVNSRENGIIPNRKRTRRNGQSGSGDGEGVQSNSGKGPGQTEA